MSFTFKRFHIDDTHCAMKVGTDGVLLGAWADVAGAKRILDIGCGSGLVALMLAQRCEAAQVVGIEIDDAAAQDAIDNAARSPFASRIDVVQADVLKFAQDNSQKFAQDNSQKIAQDNSQKFDCIVCNPPYYEEDVLPPAAQRAQARHTAGGGLTFAALLQAVSLLLDAEATTARFSVVLPTVAAPNFIALAAVHGLDLIRRTDVVTRRSKPCKRVLLEFSPHSVSLQRSTLELLGVGNERSEEYDELCKDFYL